MKKDFEAPSELDGCECHSHQVRDRLMGSQLKSYRLSHFRLALRVLSLTASDRTTYQEKVGNPMSDQSLLSTPSRSLKHGRTNTVRQTSRPLAKDAVAEEDIPETARIPPTEEGAPGGETRLESSPSKNKATPTKKKADVGAGGEPRKEKPKKVSSSWSIP